MKELNIGVMNKLTANSYIKTILKYKKHTIKSTEVTNVTILSVYNICCKQQF